LAKGLSERTTLVRSIGGNKLSLQLGDKTSFSKVFSMSSVGTHGELIVPGAADSGSSDGLQSSYLLGVSVHVAHSRFYRTKIVTLMPRLVLINQLHATVAPYEVRMPPSLLVC
jgi:hypothetical protein